MRSSPRALQPSCAAIVHEQSLGSRCRRPLSSLTSGENKRMRRRVLASASSVAPSKAPPREQVFTSDPANNVSDHVYDKMGMVLHQQKDHPIAIIKQDWKDSGMDGTEFAAKELKGALEGCAKYLFGDVEVRWVDTYFPFTDPSYELEIFFNGAWAWAFGLGLERLAMVLFEVPDIRLFWSGDERFLRQFKAGDLKTKFKPFSRYPPCTKDMAFWISPEFSENNLCELVRSIGGDLVEEVTLVDEFHNPKKGKTSNCFRITYRSMERSLTDEEINSIQEKVRAATAEQLKVELR
ncbi:hypothetical protein DUNSADRAFT_13510 [Dunaliella salina]|uniref:FDX-ACB domain-containing protein n=1 Tax=Dunaliella salina TaxID=3046 RepID=A0ABQ7G965_DUNSA|nr:hypothetical protein DUNSADRAFT_13510 [Dunaliella salina]|eukprot:KAF5831153.1 hypothetical protein DUNSADRAFT_13510 [Dunaliella salina]